MTCATAARRRRRIPAMRRLILIVFCVIATACGSSGSSASSPTAPTSSRGSSSTTASLIGTWKASAAATGLVGDVPYVPLAFAIGKQQGSQIGGEGLWGANFAEVESNDDEIDGTITGQVSGSTFTFTLTGNVGTSSTFTQHINNCPFAATGTVTVSDGTMRGTFTEMQNACWTPISGSLDLALQP